jgi:hypothetical protein
MGSKRYPSPRGDLLKTLPKKTNAPPRRIVYSFFTINALQQTSNEKLYPKGINAKKSSRYDNMPLLDF